MGAALALLLAALFGAGDQYLGSFSMHPVLADVSLLSAPWLLLAFVAGWTQRSPRRAVWLGLGCTAAALVGYGLMTLSPLEHAAFTVATVRGFAYSESPVLLGGLVTGPLFGWLGWQWRMRRAWAGALLAAAALCFEPSARALAHRAIRFETVSLAELAAGFAFATYIVGVRLLSRSSSR